MIYSMISTYYRYYNRSMFSESKTYNPWGRAIAIQFKNHVIFIFSDGKYTVNRKKYLERYLPHQIVISVITILW